MGEVAGGGGKPQSSKLQQSTVPCDRPSSDVKQLKGKALEVDCSHNVISVHHLEL